MKIELIFFLIILLFLINYNNNNNETFTSISKPNKKNLVFSSVGDNTNFHNLWLYKNRNYDVYVIYYGDNEEKYNMYKEKVDFIERRKGSKFQNFHYLYRNKPNLINNYERFFILDDDIIFDSISNPINGSNPINEMFNISKEYDLWLCGPTFKKDGRSKISWKITVNQPNNLLRFTNFVEVNTPLFNKYALDKFMKYYDPALIGWGIDYLYSYSLLVNTDIEIYMKKIALIDKITCINPIDEYKNNSRELYKVKNGNNREKIWLEYKRKNGIPDLKFKEFSKILI